MFNKSKFYISINFNLRHINRFTMYCYKSRFRRYYWNIWNQKQSLVSDSNLIKLSGGSGRTRIFDLRCIRAAF